MKSRHFILLSLFSILIAQDYHGRCPEQPYIVSRMIEELDTFYITPDSTFMIHYDISGDLTPVDMSDEDNNGTPDYIESIGVAADSAKYILNTIMDFDVVTLDEDGIYDIYIDIPHSSNNFLWGQTSEFGNSSYLRLRNGYSGLSDYCDNLEDLVWLTVGHEYFHAVQLEYNDANTEPYFKEFTSMWFENIFVPDCFDFLDFSSPLFTNPEKNFDSTPLSGSHGYSLALYGHYLGRIVDESGAENQMNGNIMRLIWDKYRESGVDAIDAVADVLFTHYEEKSFIETWVDFMSRNLYSGIYNDLNNDFYYHEGQIYLDNNPISTTSEIIGDDPINFDLTLDATSVAIQSYRVGSLESLLMIDHFQNNFIGRIAIVSNNNNLETNDLFWAVYPTTSTSSSEVKIHFVYGVDGPSETINIELTANTVPLPPTMLLGIAAQDSIILKWNPSLGPGDNLDYIIYRDDDSLDHTIDTFHVDSKGIVGFTNYTYKVTCVNEHGESQPSNSVTLLSWPTENNVSENKILSIYPNPIHKNNDSYILYALGSDYSNIILELINIRGQIVKTTSLQSDQQGWHREKINILISDQLVIGLYFLRLRPDNLTGNAKKITILP